MMKIVEGSIAKPKGFLATGLHCGIKESADSLDLGVVISEQPAVSAAVYTTNLFQAAPLHVTKQSIEKNEGKLQAVIVNSGNANACTGDRGWNDAQAMQQAVGEAFSIPTEMVGVASTGVIGEYLPMDKIQAGIRQLPPHVSEQSGPLFSKAILTTDLVEKTICVELSIDGQTITIAGAAKGSGMIHPNMATMLSFITTDAAIEPVFLQQILKKATDESFNMITVDGDTSTNDMVVVLANGLASNVMLTEQHPQAEAFYEALCFVMQDLAKKIARDGEGATKLIEVEVRQAPSIEAARQIAKSVIGSSLVKTAVYGADANWGRIICAVGYSGAQINPDLVDVLLGEIQVVKASFPVPFDEGLAKDYLEQENVKIVIDLHSGIEGAVAWGCDLTYDYVKINASYRT
ncbi:bifunctional ornithine acetyltransferase/N-acetylglutamate synthase [Ammoniphilus oxalaticus]|uniref:Arginine biosynthesis bifunctional protein ArgJ n=1 Tax=Ammoniphilus oxalaticus TaxID=66863 RepID=A0A419SK27_9BACL|nr:bifunctional ornithine acetyltransferase/N-acetylglutamate synthase [Ammoniphilus oxalaticus]RKD24332.1 bifunctional ornithine acetyltransferase/N-acetylglutamate synthase [Ammoniphilus oxalaticus]